MVNCKKEWFEMVDDKSVLEDISSRLCANKDVLNDIWKVKGSYSNRADRFRFHLELNRCNRNINKNCESDDNLREMLVMLYFTIYNVLGKV